MTDLRTLAHATDPRELAHEAMRKCNCVICHPLGHIPTCDAITESIESALRTARKEAYERAAKVMDEFGDSRRRMSGTGPNDFYTGAAAIRKLGDDNG